MTERRSPPPAGTLARCIRARGAVRRRGGGEALGALRDGAALQSGDAVETGVDGAAELLFRDGTRVHVGALSLLAAPAPGDDASGDGVQLILAAGSAWVESGQKGDAADALVLDAGSLSLTARRARFAAAAGAGGYDMATLLGDANGGVGELLAFAGHNTQVLNRVLQTVRVGADGHHVPAPMTVPSAMLAELYPDPALATALHEARRSADAADPGFQPFAALEDRLLERRFLGDAVYPGPGPGATADGADDPLLEDAFEGRRFRLRDPEGG